MHHSMAMRGFCPRPQARSVLPEGMHAYAAAPPATTAGLVASAGVSAGSAQNIAATPPVHTSDGLCTDV